MRTFLELIASRRQAYRRVFFGEGGEPHRNAEIVLADLARFCRARSSCAVVSPISKQMDPLAMAMAEGRREVWLRIQQYLHMEERVVMQLREADNDG